MSSALQVAVRSFPIPPPNKGHICQFHNSLMRLSLVDLGIAKIRLFHILPKLFFIGTALRCYNCHPWRDLHPRRLIAHGNKNNPKLSLFSAVPWQNRACCRRRCSAVICLFARCYRGRVAHRVTSAMRPLVFGTTTGDCPCRLCVALHVAPRVAPCVRCFVARSEIGIALFSITGLYGGFSFVGSRVSLLYYLLYRLTDSHRCCVLKQCLLRLIFVVSFGDRLCLPAMLVALHAQPRRLQPLARFGVHTAV